MNLGQLKKNITKYLEEYSETGTNYTNDNEISLKLCPVINAIIMEISKVKRIKKVHTIVKDNAIEGVYTLPAGIYQIKSIPRYTELTEDNKTLTLLEDFESGKVVYYAYPTDITDETEDSFEIELEPDAQAIIVYGVVADILKMSYDKDYRVFEQKYNSLLSTLKEKKDNTVTIARVYNRGYRL